MREVDLYPPVREHLMQQGFAVTAEVNHCDLVAVRTTTPADGRQDELIVVELKLSPNIKLLVQATERQRLTSDVYIAVPEPARVNRHWRGIERVVKRLGLGLILIRHSPLGSSACTKIQPAYQGGVDGKARAALLTELSGRAMSYNTGGSSHTRLLTAYKETAITIAAILNHLGPQPVKFIKRISGDKTQGILANNHYGWFERVKRGTYTLTGEGQASLREFPDLQARALKRLSE